MTISARLRPDVTLAKIEKLLLDGSIRPMGFAQLQHSYLFTGEQIQLNQLRAALETQFGKDAILKWDNQHENITVGAPNHTALSERQAHLIVNVHARLRPDISGDEVSQFLENAHPAQDVSLTRLRGSFLFHVANDRVKQLRSEIEDYFGRDAILGWNTIHLTETSASK